jgi:hypothetical protein
MREFEGEMKQCMQFPIRIATYRRCLLPGTATLAMSSTPA